MFSLSSLIITLYFLFSNFIRPLCHKVTYSYLQLFYSFASLETLQLFFVFVCIYIGFYIRFSHKRKKHSVALSLLSLNFALHFVSVLFAYVTALVILINIYISVSRFICLFLFCFFYFIALFVLFHSTSIYLSSQFSFFAYFILICTKFILLSLLVHLFSLHSLWLLCFFCQFFVAGKSVLSIFGLRIEKR